MINNIKTKQDIKKIINSKQFKNTNKICLWGNNVINQKETIDKILIQCKNPIINMNNQTLLFSYHQTFNTFKK